MFIAADDGIPAMLEYIINAIVDSNNVIIYIIISEKIDFSILVLNIRYTKIGILKTFIKLLYGAGMINVFSIDIPENKITNNTLDFKDESIFNIVKNNNI